MKEKTSPGIFADATNDFAFKRIFGSEKYKAATIGFLNSILKGKEPPVVDVSFLNVEVQGLSAEDRKVVVDVACRSERGETFVVEMQRVAHSHFMERMVFYASCIVSHMAERRSRWSYMIDPVHVIAILKGSYPHPESAGVYATHYVTEEETLGIRLDGSPDFYFFELDRFSKKREEIDNSVDYWLYLLKESQFMEKEPEGFKADPGFAAFFDAAKTAAFTKEERIQYDSTMITDFDIYYIKEDAKKEGWAEGKEAGLAEGLAEGSAKNARRMLAKGYPVTEIADITGLSAEEIAKLGTEKIAELSKS